MVETEIAWAAGFFDGEGYIGMRTSGQPYQRKDGSFGKQYHSVRMAVVQTGVYAIPLLERFKYAVNNLGTIKGPIKVREGWSERYEWNCDGKEKCEQVIKILDKYLGPAKSEQAWNALARLELILREKN